MGLVSIGGLSLSLLCFVLLLSLVVRTCTAMIIAVSLVSYFVASCIYACFFPDVGYGICSQLMNEIKEEILKIQTFSLFLLSSLLHKFNLNIWYQSR